MLTSGATTTDVIEATTTKTLSTTTESSTIKETTTPDLDFPVEANTPEADDKITNKYTVKFVTFKEADDTQKVLKVVPPQGE